MLEGGSIGEIGIRVGVDVNAIWGFAAVAGVKL